MMEKQRISYYDLAKFVAIGTVIYGHSIQHYGGGNLISGLPYLVIYSFHMPLFMLISGFFSSNSLKLDFMPFIKKKSIQLLIPYLSWQIISISIKSGIGNFILEDVIRWDFWFLISLYICSVLAWLVYHMPKIMYKILVLIFTLLLTQVSIFRLRDMYPCFLFGLLFAYKADFVKKYNKQIFLCSLIIYIVLSSLTLNEHFFDVGFSPKGILKQINVIVVGISGSLVVIWLCKQLDTISANRFSSIGQNTLGIYLIQSLLFTLTKNYVTIDGYYTFLLYVVIFPIIVALYIYISLFIIRLIYKNKHLSFYLLGKSK